MSTKDNRISFEARGHYPFTTPEGYFDDLTARIMKQIPEDTAINDFKVSSNSTAATGNTMASHTPASAISVSKTKSRKHLWSNITTVAASLVLIAMVAARLLSAPHSTENTAKQDTQQNSTESYNEELMNYAMMDNMDVYCYLSGEGGE